MELIILKTDLNNALHVTKFKPLFDLHPSIIDWHVDTEDSDNVLRIETSELKELDIIQLLTSYGINSEPLA